MSRSEKSPEPSQQQIQDMLSGLNRQEKRAWAYSSASEQAWQKGMNNYLKWFKDRDITIHLDPIVTINFGACTELWIEEREF